MEPDNQDYVDSVCEHCGQRIEFPMDRQGDTAPCPACGKEIKLFVRETHLPEQKIVVPTLYKELPSIYRHNRQLHQTPTPEASSTSRPLLPLPSREVCKNWLRWTAVLPATILMYVVCAYIVQAVFEEWHYVTVILPNIALRAYVEIFAALLIPPIVVFAGSMIAPKHQFFVSVVLAVLNAVFEIEVPPKRWTGAEVFMLG